MNCAHSSSTGKSANVCYWKQGNKNWQYNSSMFLDIFGYESFMQTSLSEVSHIMFRKIFYRITHRKLSLLNFFARAEISSVQKMCALEHFRRGSYGHFVTRMENVLKTLEFCKWGDGWCLYSYHIWCSVERSMRTTSKYLCGQNLNVVK